MKVSNGIYHCGGSSPYNDIDQAPLRHMSVGVYLMSLRTDDVVKSSMSNTFIWDCFESKEDKI